jgi:hypothetical protein
MALARLESGLVQGWGTEAFRHADPASGQAHGVTLGCPKAAEMMNAAARLYCHDAGRPRLAESGNALRPHAPPLDHHPCLETLAPQQWPETGRALSDTASTMEVIRRAVSQNVRCSAPTPGARVRKPRV